MDFGFGKTHESFGKTGFCFGKPLEKAKILLGFEAYTDGETPNDIEGIRSILENYIVCSFSYYDLTSEKDYQNVLTTLVAVLFDSYVVKSEVNGKKGRADIMVSPKRKGDLGMVIEVKYNAYPLSRSRLLYQAESAITKQVEAKDYYRELRQRERGKIILFGFAFDSGGNHQIATRVIG